MKLINAWIDGGDILARFAVDSRRVTRRVGKAWYTAFVEKSVSIRNTSRDVCVSDDYNYHRLEFPDSRSRENWCYRTARTYGQEKVREGDVGPVQRWIAETNKEFEDNIRLLYLDIEAQEPGKGIDDARNGDVHILSWVAYDSDGVVAEAVLSHSGNPVPGSPELLEDERRVLSKLVETMRGYDAVAAWHGGDERRGDGSRGRGFDFDTIRNRCERIGVLLGSEGGRALTWDRWIWIDQLAIWKKYGGGSGETKSSNKLGHVAAALGITDGKIDLPGHLIWQTWAESSQGAAEVLRYNRRDTELLVEIERRTGLIDLHLTVCRKCNQIPHSSALAATAQGDGYLLRFAASRGYRWPTVNRGSMSEEKAPGAFVFPPKRQGVLHDICVADFTALYPSVIRSLNIGPDTVVADPRDLPGVRLARAPTHLVNARNPSVWFRQDRVSHFVAALEDMVASRKEYQEARDRYQPGTPEYKRYSALDTAAKIVANSFYGILLAKSWRYYDRLAGLAVTQTAVWLIKEVDRSATAAGFAVIGGDTDSVFVDPGGATITPRGSDALLTPLGERFRSWVAGLNATWAPRFADMGSKSCHIELDWEKVFARMLIPLGADGKPVKKLYAGALSLYKGQRPKSGFKPEIKGIAIQRGDRTQLAREMQQELLDMLLGDMTTDDLPNTPDVVMIQVWVAEWEARIRKGLTLEQATVTKSLRHTLSEYRRTNFTSAKCRYCSNEFPEGIDSSGPAACPRCNDDRPRVRPPAHARIAEKLAAKGAKPMVGDRIPYVLVVSGKDTEAVHADTPGVESRLDLGYYWRNTYAQSYVFLIAVWPETEWEKPHHAEKRIRREIAAQLAEQAVGTDDIFSAGFDIVVRCPAGGTGWRQYLVPGQDHVTIDGAEFPGVDAATLLDHPRIQINKEGGYDWI